MTSTDSPQADWPSAGLTTLGAVALAVGFVLLVGRYYAFYHLGGAGAAMGLLLVVLPAATLVACAVALAAAALLLALMFSLEVGRNAALRSGEGIAAGDLAPLVRTLVGR